MTDVQALRAYFAKQQCEYIRKYIEAKREGVIWARHYLPRVFHYGRMKRMMK